MEGAAGLKVGVRCPLGCIVHRLLAAALPSLAFGMYICTYVRHDIPNLVRTRLATVPRSYRDT